MRLLEEFLEACDPSLDETMCLDEAWVEAEDAYGFNFFYNNEWFDIDDLENITIFPLDDDTFSVAVDGYVDYSRFKNKTFASFEEAKRYAEYLYKRYFLKESLNESMTKEELDAKAFIIQYLNRNKYSQIVSLLNDFDFKLTEDPDIVGYVDLNTKHVVLNRNLSMDDAIKCILDTLREKHFKQALKDPDIIQQIKDDNKEFEKLLRDKIGALNESTTKEDLNDIDSINKKIIASCDPESTLIEVLNACGGKLTWAASDLGLTVDELKFAIKFYGLDQDFDSFDN